RERRRTLLIPHLHQLAVLLLRLNEQLSLARIMARWVFDVDMLAGLQSKHSHRRMPVVGSSDADRVHILRLKRLAEVAFSNGRIAQRLCRACGELRQHLRVDVAAVRHPRRGLVRVPRGEMRAATPIQSHRREVDALIRSQNLCIALGCRGDCGPRDPNCNTIHELPTCDHLHFPRSIRLTKTLMLRKTGHTYNFTPIAFLASASPIWR